MTGAMFEAMISGSVLILVILLIRIFSRGKVSCMFRYSLWGIVLLRLLLPLSMPESPFSVINMLEDDNPFGVVSLYLSSRLSDSPGSFSEEPENSSEKSERILAESDWNSDGTEGIAAETDNLAVSSDQGIFHSGNNIRNFRSTCRMIWLWGTAATGAWFVIQNLICAYHLRKKRIYLQGQEMNQFFSRIKLSLPVYVVDDLSSPCLFGLLRPCIYLTPKAAENETIFHYALVHELTHARHLDPVWTFLRNVTVSLYWWNPLIWIAAYVSRMDCELTCDEAVIKLLGEECRFEYGRILLELVSVKRTSAIFSSSATLINSRKHIKERIYMISEKRKNRFSVMLISLLFLILAAGCTFTGSEEKSDEISADGQQQSKAEKNVKGHISGSIETDTLLQEIEGTSAEGVSEFLLSHLKCSLPDGLTVGDFDIYLGGGGGYPIIDKNDEIVGSIEIWRSINGIFENGQLTGIDSIANHSSHDEFSVLRNDVPCVAALFSFDMYDESYYDEAADKTGAYTGESNCWYAFWAQENMEPVYALWLNADMDYQSEDLEQIAETMSFSDGAFLTSLQMASLESTFEE